MRFSFLSIAILIVCVANAQQARVQPFNTGLCGTVNLSQVEDKYGARVYSLEMPEPDAGTENEVLERIKEVSAKLFPRKTQATEPKTTSTSKPIFVKGYIADSLTGIPPDNDMAISKGNKSVSVVNTNIAVHNAVTGHMNYRIDLYLFSLSIGLNSANDFRYDPKIMYDPEADKYILVMLNGTDLYNYIIVGFSQSNDPSGNWNFYKFYGDYANDSTWFDYPTVAITHKEFFLTGNKLKFNSSWQTGFVQSVIYQINKQSGYNGDSILKYQIWDSIAFNGRNIRNLYPVKGGNMIYGPEQYFLSNRNFDVWNDTVFLIKMPDTIGSNNTTLSITPLTSSLSYCVPPNGREPDTSALLATNDARILGAFRVGNEVQFTSTTKSPIDGNSSVFHGKITNLGGIPSLSTNYVINDTIDFGYPNLSYAGTYSGKVTSIISFNYTGPNKFPGVGAVYYDGQNFSDMLDVKQGLGSIKMQTGKDQRWGDYMGSQPEWDTLGNVWIEGIFGRADKRYGNFMAKLSSPFLNGINQVNIPKIEEVIYPNPSYQFTNIEFNLKEPENLSFYLFDINGKLVDRILQQHCEEGNNIIQFNVASLASGVYFLKAKDNEGNVVMTNRFVKE
jgi:hypothetical protein